MAIVHNDNQGVGPGPLLPSAHPTQRPSVLLSLRDPINLACASTVRSLLIGAKMMKSLIDTGKLYHLHTSEHENTPLSALPIRYSPHSPSSLKENQP
jgi:hypothetical protein